MMSLSRRGGSAAADTMVPRILGNPSKFSKLSKKLKNKRDPPVPMNDLPPDAPPVECPPVYDCYVTMKPQRKHRLTMAKRYFGKVTRGMMRLTPEKSAKASTDAIGSEYTIDLTAVSVSCDDARRRLIMKFKTESRHIGPVNKDEYETFKEMIQRHRNYRQWAYRNKKEEPYELISAGTNPINGKTSSDPVLPENKESESTAAKSREDIYNPMVILNDKVTKIGNDIKMLTTEMKHMHKELKILLRCVQGGKPIIKEAGPVVPGVPGAPRASGAPGAPKLDEDDESTSDDSDDQFELAIADGSQTYVASAPSRESVKDKIKEKGSKPKEKDKKDLMLKYKLSSEDLDEKKEEKPCERVEGAEPEKAQQQQQQHPPRKRRDQLPKPAIPGEELGLRQLMAIIARRIPVPISFFEPLSMLQVLCEELRYAGQTLGRALQTADSTDRMAYVTAFAVSAYAGMACRKQKPFNPLLGETFDFISDDGWKYHAEQVSHHPAITAAHAEGLNWSWWQTLISTPKTSWTGTIEATPELPVRVRLGKEDYCWNRIKVIIENASSAAECRKLKMEGTMNMRCSNGYTSSVIFRKDRQTEVTGSIMDNRGVMVAKLTGFCDRFLQKMNQKDYLFEAIPLPRNANQYYGFSQFASGLNEFLPDEKANAPPTDSRNRPDIRALENADAARAVEAKGNLEKAQRLRNEATHKRMWFEQRQDQMTNTSMWVCNGRYWQAKEKKFKGYTDMLQLFCITDHIDLLLEYQRVENLSTMLTFTSSSSTLLGTKYRRHSHLTKKLDEYWTDDQPSRRKMPSCLEKNGFRPGCIYWKVKKKYKQKKKK